MAACSSTGVVASTASVVAGNINPCPADDGVTKMVASHSGTERSMAATHTLPTIMLMPPATCGAFMRPVAVSQKPVLTPKTVVSTAGTPRRSPAAVGVSACTAW